VTRVTDPSDTILAGRRILLAEDEILVSMMLEDMLADLGCEIVGPAATFSRALALAESAPCDAAILDLNLEGRESYPVADVLRQRGIPVIFSTGYDAVRSEYGGCPCLRKPFQQPQLIAVLAGLLGQQPAP
jgi:CheY-like chemotaxis protein